MLWAAVDVHVYRQYYTVHTFKGIFSDFNKIILWHKSTDIKKKRLFPKFHLILIFRLQVMHDYVHGSVDCCVKLILVHENLC